MTVHEVIYVIVVSASCGAAGLFWHRWRLVLRELNDADRLYRGLYKEARERYVEEWEKRMRLEQGHADWRREYILEAARHNKTARKLAELENARNEP